MESRGKDSSRKSLIVDEEPSSGAPHESIILYYLTLSYIVLYCITNPFPDILQRGTSFVALEQGLPEEIIDLDKESCPRARLKTILLFGALGGKNSFFGSHVQSLLHCG